MEYKELIAEFRKEYDMLKKRHNKLPDYSKLNKIFYIEDFVAKTGFITDVSRMLCWRVIEILTGWSDYMHYLLVPNPNSMIAVTESGLFNDEEKKAMTKLISRIMHLKVRNSKASMKHDTSKDIEIINDAVEFWERELYPATTKILDKTESYWEKSYKGEAKDS